MMKVFLHTRNIGEFNWINELREFARIPVEGEYLTLSSTSDWYKIQLVVHTPFECDCHAEVYAVKVDHDVVMKEALNKY